MENKLQQLTEKLYSEGLAKGRAQAQEELEAAQAKGGAIIAAAQAQANAITQTAKDKAQELINSTQAELRLMATQMTSELHSAIENIITVKVATSATDSAWADGEFVKSMVLDAVKRFDPKADQPIEVILPEAADKALVAALAKEFAQGVEVSLTSRIKTPLRIAPKDGGYYVSLTKEEFNDLVCSYIRPVVAKMLFEK
ncbi:MAG: hypothetical protein R3Y19_03130 [Rikenellaceae bacterium]